MWFCRHLLTVSGLVFQPLGWTPSLTEFQRSMFLICTFAYFVHQLVLSRYAHVLHLFFIIVSQFQLQFPLMFLTSVGAFSSFYHADTISHVRWCSLLSYVHYWKREKFRNFVFATEWRYFLITISSCIYGNVHQRAQSLLNVLTYMHLTQGNQMRKRRDFGTKCFTC